MGLYKSCSYVFFFSFLYLHCGFSSFIPGEEGTVTNLPKQEKYFEKSGAPSGSSKCKCENYECSCCQGVDVSKIGLNVTLCFNTIYLKEEIGLEVKITLNSYTIFDEKVSARNPPPICFGKPYTFDLAEACIRFYNVTVNKEHFHSCVKLEGYVEHFRIPFIDLGCFDIKGKSQNQEPQALMVH